MIDETNKARCEYKVEFSIANTSNVDGAEIAQVYVAAPEGGARPRSPPKELEGFVKRLVRAGSSETLSVQLDKSAFSFWDESKDAWHVAPGRYTIQVGSSSRDMHLSGHVDISETILWRGL